VVTRETVEHIAKLAKLRFSDEEMDAFVEQFQKIIAYVDRLRDLDTGEIDVGGPGGIGREGLREDRVEVWSGAGQSLENAPDRRGSLFCVPRVVDKGDSGGSP
jgi:aspartyl-tRNA(Asn)/glutamyl-tRNA(Gln) amidotransferase subunit C